MKYQLRAGVITPFVQKYYKLLILAIAGLFTLSYMVMTLTASAAPKGNNAADAADMSEICHKTDEGWMKIFASSRSLKGHLGHGDNGPGKFVEATSGDWFGNDCDVLSRYGEITSPLSDEEFEVGGTVTLSAFLVDKDGNDNVQWAVRRGTCAAGTNTVAGNVDGFNNGNGGWDHYNFNYVWNTAGALEGNYCFIFNPTESAGDPPVRETVEFKLMSTREFQLLADDLNGINIPTVNGVSYEVEVEGYWNNDGPKKFADAECVSVDGTIWEEFENLDVQIDTEFVDWGSCDEVDHTYTTEIIGDGSFNLRIFDGNTGMNTPTPSWYTNNNGGLIVTVTSL